MSFDLPPTTRPMFQLEVGFDLSPGSDLHQLRENESYHTVYCANTAGGT